MPAAAWAARSGDPVLFTGRNQVPQATLAALRRHAGRDGLRARARVRDLDRARRAGRAGRRRACSGSAPAARSQNALVFARYSDGSLRLEHQRPRPRAGARQRRPAPRRRGRGFARVAAASGGRCCSPTTADALPPELRSFLLDIKPGYEADPTRAVYNHIWLMGDATAIGGEVQARGGRAGRAGPDRPRRRDPGEPAGGVAQPASRRERAAIQQPQKREEMSEAERPDRLSQAGDGRGHPGPRRPLHPALRAPDPQPDPAADRAAAGGRPRAREGERQIARLEELAQHSGDPRGGTGVGSLMKELADGVWHLKCLPGLPWAVNAYLAGDVLIDAGCRQSTRRILKQLDGHEVRRPRAHPRASRPPGREPRGLRGARHPVLVPRAGRARGRGPEADRRAPARQVHGPLLLADLPRARAKVDRAIKEGDEVAGFEVIDAPGPLGRPRRLLARVGPRADPRRRARPTWISTPGSPASTSPTGPHPRPGENRESARKLAALEPELVCFGHGAPLRDPKKLTAFVEGLSD